MIKIEPYILNWIFNNAKKGAKPPVPDWSEIGYSETPQDVIDDFNYSKSIADNWDISTTSMLKLYYNNKNLKYFPLIDISNVTVMTDTFQDCSNLKSIPLLNTGNVIAFVETFLRCDALVDVPVLDLSNAVSVRTMFGGCGVLSNQSLNNIMLMAININPSYTQEKTLKQFGLSQTQAETCQTLSNWDAFVAAGWSSGY